MASYLDKLTADMKVAMKAGDKPRLSVVRMLISDLKKRADANDGKQTDDDEVAVLQKAVKMRADTVTQATAAGRDDIAKNEQAEIEMIQTYLPQQMSADEVAAKVKEIATEIDFQGGKDMGRFMKEWMSRYKGLADGRLVQQALKSLG